ncbi:MAG: glycosyltransferase family 87 protein [Candidatus Eiseniibacteriota bacterium]
MTGSAPKRWAALAFVAATVALVWLAWTSTWDSTRDFVREVDINPRLFADYTMRFHPVAEDLLERRRPYPGYYYSPTFAVLIAPLGALSLPGALTAWGVLQGLWMLGLLLVPGPWLVRRGRVLFWAYVLVFLTSMPVLHNFKWGQVSVLMTLLAFGSMFLYGYRRVVAAALVLAFAVSIKFYPVVYLAYFLFRRDWRFLAWFAAGWAAFGFLLPALVLGPRDTIGFYRDAAANMETDRAKITVDVNSQYLPHVVERWSYRADGAARPLGEDGSGTRTALRWAAGALFAMNLVLLGRWMRGRPGSDPIPAFALLSLSIPLIIPTAWPHYFVFLPFLQVWAAWRISRAGRRFSPTAAVLLASVIASSVAGYRLAGDWWTYSHAGVTLLSTLGVLIVVYAEGAGGERGGGVTRGYATRSAVQGLDPTPRGTRQSVAR